MGLLFSSPSTPTAVDGADFGLFTEVGQHTLRAVAFSEGELALLGCLVIGKRGLAGICGQRGENLQLIHPRPALAVPLEGPASTDGTRLILI